MGPAATTTAYTPSCPPPPDYRLAAGSVKDARGALRKTDAVAVLTARLLPTPLRPGAWPG